MQKLIVSALLLALAGGAQAAHKCTGPDGKVTYTDALCDKDTAKEATVQTGANTIDSSGYRAALAKDQAEKKAVEVANKKGKEDEGHCPGFAGAVPTSAEAKANLDCVGKKGK